MRFNFVWLFVLLLFIGGVFGAENGTEGSGVQGEGDGKAFTAEFYIALLVGLGALALLGWIIWLFIRGPRNKWDK